VLAERSNSHVQQPGGSGPVLDHEDCLEFVRFCYRRRRVGWPELYDEMCAVAARGSYRGLGYAELAERGISFCLTDLPRLAALTDRVLREEHSSAEPGRAEVAGAALRLSGAAATG
jgi:hypothetical protein